MDKSTPIDNVKNDNSSDIDDIINQIEQDNKVIQEISSQPPQEIQENIINEGDEDTSSVLDILWYEFKGPLLVALLCIMFTLHGPDNLIENFIPFLWSDDSQSLNYFGLIIKASVFGIIYFIIHKYLL